MLRRGEFGGEFALQGTERAVRRGRATGFGSSFRRDARATQMRGERFERVQIAQQLAECDLHAEFSRERQRDLREKQGVETKFEQARRRGHVSEIDAGKFGEKLFELRKRGVCLGSAGVLAFADFFRIVVFKSSFRRDAETNRRDACATRRRFAVGRGGGERERDAGRQVGEVALALERIRWQRDAAAGFV